MAELLTDAQLSEALEHLADWHRAGEGTGAKDARLVRKVELPSFPEAIQAVNRIAEIAENTNHHPDIDIRWRTLTFHLTTHSAGGITANDTALANEINAVVDDMTSGSTTPG